MGSEDTVKQLNSARAIVLGDPAIYPQVVPGVLPVIGPAQPVELRRWGADFLAETFASPMINAEEKGKMCLGVLDTLKGYLCRKDDMGQEEDTNVLKSAIQCVASIYPLVFRHAINDGTAQEVWSKVMSMKSAILRNEDKVPPGVRICCIKFLARVVQVQTPGLISDPRRPDQNEISLALVPREHAFLTSSQLDGEATALLDRLLFVLQENSSDALIVTSTLNALATLVQRRASISTKILNVILNFNPFSVTTTAKDRVAARSMARTVVSFINNVLKRTPTHPLAARMQGHVDRLRQVSAEPFAEQNGLKRGPDEPIDGFQPNKRVQLDVHADSGTPPIHQRLDGSLPPGPVSYKDLYTLTSDPRVAGFHVGVLPDQIVAQLVPVLLQRVDQAQFDQALNVLRSRVLELQRRPLNNASDPGRGPEGLGTGDEEDEEYDPSALGFGETDQIAPHTGAVQEQPLEVMKMAPDPPLSKEERAQYADHAGERLFITLREIDGQLATKRAAKKTGLEKEKIHGFNRSVVASTGEPEREGWIMLLVRLATRSGLRPEEVNENEDERAMAKKDRFFDLPSRIRDALNKYIMDDWRRRIDVAITWLNEEWYTDRLAASDRTSGTDLPNYNPLTLYLLDELVPYIDIKDGRYLIRFLSEIPYLPPEIFQRVKKIAEDPERVAISTQTLLYLIMLRPPVREMAIECATEIWRENKDAKAQIEKILVKWRPEVLRAAKEESSAAVEETRVKVEGAA